MILPRAMLTVYARAVSSPVLNKNKNWLLLFAVLSSLFDETKSLRDDTIFGDPSSLASEVGFFSALWAML